MRKQPSSRKQRVKRGRSTIVPFCHHAIPRVRRGGDEGGFCCGIVMVRIEGTSLGMLWYPERWSVQGGAAATCSSARALTAATGVD